MAAKNTKRETWSVDELISRLKTDDYDKLLPELKAIMKESDKKKGKEAVKALAEITGTINYKPKKAKDLSTRLLCDVFTKIDDTVKLSLIDPLGNAMNEKSIDGRVGHLLHQIIEKGKKTTTGQKEKIVGYFLGPATSESRRNSKLAMSYLEEMKDPVAKKALKKLEQAPEKKKSKKELVIEHVLAAYQYHYETDESDKEILKVHVYQMEPDPVHFYQLVETIFNIDSDPLWGKSVKEIIDIVVSDWDGEYLYLPWKS